MAYCLRHGCLNIETTKMQPARRDSNLIHVSPFSRYMFIYKLPCVSFKSVYFHFILLYFLYFNTIIYLTLKLQPVDYLNKIKNRWLHFILPHQLLLLSVAWLFNFILIIQLLLHSICKAVQGFLFFFHINQDWNLSRKSSSFLKQLKPWWELNS